MAQTLAISKELTSMATVQQRFNLVYATEIAFSQNGLSLYQL
jgi:hypothetical protein